VDRRARGSLARRFVVGWLARSLAIALVALLSPLWLGPMLMPIERAVAEAHHVCACGMAVGTCGCPECEELERARHHGDSPAYPVLKGECDEGSALLGAAPLPPALLPAPVAVMPKATVTILDTPPRSSLASRAPPGPPTPPPRRS